MTSILSVFAPTHRFPDFSVGARPGGIHDLSAKLFYFTLIAIVFAFVLTLTSGAHP